MYRTLTHHKYWIKVIFCIDILSRKFQFSQCLPYGVITVNEFEGSLTLISHVHLEDPLE